jgi:hypothetical protein
MQGVAETVRIEPIAAVANKPRRPALGWKAMVRSFNGPTRPEQELRQATACTALNTATKKTFVICEFAFATAGAIGRSAKK